MTWFARLFPHPILTVVLTLMWWVIENLYSFGSLVLGFIIGFALSHFVQRFWPERARVKKPFKMLTFFALVIWDIIVANVVVAQLVLFRRSDRFQSAFLDIPLDVRSPDAITLLANTITLTPGTLSAEVSRDRRRLLVHALNSPDPDAEIIGIKHRYERRIKEFLE